MSHPHASKERKAGMYRALLFASCIAVAIGSAGGCGRLPRPWARKKAPAAEPAEAARPGPAPSRLLPLGRDDGIRAAATIRGKVTAADKFYGIVVINVGELNGVRAGYAFTVYRAEKFIGTIVVDDTFPDMSSAHYGKTMKGHVEIGDEVTTQLATDL
ncbi:MAG TPA: hypothetical protein VNE39_08960 [Planctomycetota bacterium]|nr:hypothetical protein [Planctomycetota bacterium]